MKNKNLIFAIGVLLILGVVVFYAFSDTEKAVKPQPEEPTPNATTTETEKTTSTETEKTTSTEELAKKAKEEVELVVTEEGFSKDSISVSRNTNLIIKNQTGDIIALNFDSKDLFDGKSKILENDQKRGIFLNDPALEENDSLKIWLGGDSEKTMTVNFSE